MRQAVVLFTIQFLLFTGLTSLCSYGYAQDNVLGNGGNNPAKDSNEVSIDSGKAAILEEMKANSDLETEVKYKAEEFMILDMEKKSLYLQKGAELNYEDMALKADSIAINWENNTLTAGGKVDSTGQITGRPRLEENEQTYKAKGVDYNFKTRKGLVRGARTKQGEEYILADVVRKQDGETYYIKDGKFTSCDLEDPHYYIKSSKLKIIPKDKIITGPLMLVIEDFPLPLILPFGFFPSQTGQRSGIIMPTYGEAAARGFFLRNGGYYFALNDNFDLAFRGDIFSRGGWRVEAATTYNKRYAFKGNFKLEYALQRFGEKTDPAYREQKNFWVKWDHKQKITPQTDFTATVSLGSNNFFSNNSYDQRDRFSNTLKSTVNFNQRFANSPWRLNAQLSQSQNTQTRNVTLGLPTLDLSRTRWLPFKGPNATGKKWYHKIGLGYKATVKNQISVIDSLVDDVLFHPNATVTQVIEQGDSMVSVVGPALDYFSNGMIQSIPVSTQLTILKYITASPSLSYNEYWYIKSVKKTFNQAENKVESENIYGFNAARDFSFRFNTTTRIYGVFQFKGKKKMAFRHTIIPNLAYSYHPDFADDFWGFFDKVQSDTVGNELTYSRFENAIVGGPRAGESQTLNFGLNNILQMKYVPKNAEQDTTKKDPYTRYNLLDNFGINTSYNFAADSLNLGNINFSARTNILNNKFSVNLNGAVDPYAVSPTGRRTNTFRYTRNGTIARTSSMRLALNTTFSSKRNKGGGAVLEAPPVYQNNGRYSEEEWNYMQYYGNLYADFTVPWRLNVSYTLAYTNNGVRKDTSMVVNFNGDFNLSPKWKVQFTSGYDFGRNDFSPTTFTINRDLHCWEMKMTWIPFGDRKSYNLSIAVKSSTLSDLKLTKRRDWQDRF